MEAHELGTWIANFLLDCQARGLAKDTVQWHKSNLGQLRTYADRAGWVRITVHELRAYLVHLQERDRYSGHPTRPVVAGGLTTYSQIAHVRTIKRFFGWLAAEGMIEVNPAAGLKVPRKPKRVPRRVVKGDVVRLLAVAGVRDRALIWFLAGTGCRVGETCALRWADVDLDQGTATVRGKGDKEREVILEAPLVAALRAWREAQGAHEHVFTGPHGPLTPSGVNHMLKRLAKRAGVTGRVNPHAFRHGFGRAWVMNGGDLGSLAEQLGHSDIEVTRIYTWLCDEERREKHRLHSPVTALAEAVGRLARDGEAPSAKGQAGV